MKRCSSCKEVLALDQFYNNRRTKDGLDDRCKACDKARHASKAEQVKAIKAAYYAANTEVIKAARADWRRSNPDTVARFHSDRDSRLKTHTPPWLSPAQRAEMDAIRQEARRLTVATGVAHTSDHIIALCAAVLCKGHLIEASGLEVPWNLQILTASENSQKRTSFGHGWSDFLEPKPIPDSFADRIIRGSRAKPAAKPPMVPPPPPQGIPA